MSNWKIRIEPDGIEVESWPGESVLATLRRAAPGILIVGCRRGGCGICKIKVVSGKATLGLCSAAELTAEEREQGMALACKAYPESDLVIEPVRRAKQKLA